VACGKSNTLLRPPVNASPLSMALCELRWNMKVVSKDFDIEDGRTRVRGGHQTGGWPPLLCMIASPNSLAAPQAQRYNITIITSEHNNFANIGHPPAVRSQTIKGPRSSKILKMIRLCQG